MGNGYSNNYYGQPDGYYGPSFGYVPYAQFFGPEPQKVLCPKCKQIALTKIKYVLGNNGWSGFICLIVLGIFLGFIAANLFINCKTDYWKCLVIIVVGTILFCILLPIPFCCDLCKDAEHRCGICDTYIGKYVRDNRRPIILQPPEFYKNQVNQPPN